MRLLFLFASLLLTAIAVAQTQKASGVADFISVDTPVFVFDHVRVIGVVEGSPLHYLKLGLGGAQIEVNQRLI
jgi:hypothetical protein